MWGGEIFVPKIPSYRIIDLAKAVNRKCKRVFVGIRSGEKLHEEMITTTDSLNSIEFRDYYVILPAAPPKWDIEKFIRESDDSAGLKITEEFSYNSGLNDRFLTVSELKKLILTEINV
jgi:Predicted nucleoside-diphosphate sugar epimerases